MGALIVSRGIATRHTWVLPRTMGCSCVTVRAVGVPSLSFFRQSNSRTFGCVLGNIACSVVLIQLPIWPRGTAWLRTMNARRLFESALKFVSYMTRNSSRCLNTKLHRLKNLLHLLHRTKPDVLHHPQHGGARSMGAGYASSCGCLLYTSPSPRDRSLSRMPSSA